MKLSQFQKDQLLSEVEFSASRGGGPGGQNVNKVNTKVELRFAINKTQFFTESQKQQILSRIKNRITTSEELIITASSERTQWRNREKATHKFFELIEKALTPPKKRIKTKPTKASKIKRLENKKKMGQKKQLRKPPEA